MHLVVCHYTLCFINVIPVPVQIAIVERELLLETVMRSRSLRRTSCLSAWVGRRPCNFALLPATREICHTLRDGACVEPAYRVGELIRVDRLEVVVRHGSPLVQPSCLQ